MAKIYSKNNSLKQQYEDAKKKLTIAYGAVAVFFVAWIANIIIFHSFNPLFLFPCFMGFFVSGACSAALKKKVEKLESGVQGETNTIQFISTLPDTYSAIQNVRVEYEGKVSELDTVVVGPNGIFVIETKNHNGTISGSYIDDRLLQSKVGQGGTPYSNQFYNPVKQVSTHVYRLSNMLRDKGFDVWVQSVVYFSNPRANVEVEYDFNQTPVFAKQNNGDRELCTYINEYEGKTQLNYNDVEEIVNILIK